MVAEVAEPPWESVTFAVKLYVPGATEAETVPVMVPVAPMLNPFGRLPLLRVQASGPTPPVAARVPEYAAPTAAAGENAPPEVMASFPLMVMVRVAGAVCFAESVTVTVNENVPVAVPVPEITPPELSTSPAGRLPAVTAQV